jgi:hypothetical protein
MGGGEKKANERICNRERYGDPQPDLDEATSGSAGRSPGLNGKLKKTYDHARDDDQRRPSFPPGSKPDVYSFLTRL